MAFRLQPLLKSRASRILSWVAAGGIVYAWSSYNNRDNGEIVEQDAVNDWNKKIVAPEKQKKASGQSGGAKVDQ